MISGNRSLYGNLYIFKGGFIYLFTIQFHNKLILALVLILAEIVGQNDGTAASKSVCNRDSKVPQYNAKMMYILFCIFVFHEQIWRIENPGCDHHCRFYDSKQNSQPYKYSKIPKLLGELLSFLLFLFNVT